MYRISKSFSFSAAHKLESSFTEACQDIHGHNYKVEIIVECRSLNKDGMVIDFGKIKHIAKQIMEEYDHKLLLSHSYASEDDTSEVILACNPTSENIARLIYTRAESMLLDLSTSDREQSLNGHLRYVRVCKVRIYETDSSWSEYIG